MVNNVLTMLIFLGVLAISLFSLTRPLFIFFNKNMNNPPNVSAVNLEEVRGYLEQPALSFDDKKLVLENYSRIFDSQKRILNEIELISNKIREKNLFLLTAAALFISGSGLFLAFSSKGLPSIKIDYTLITLFFLLFSGIVFLYFAESKSQSLLRGFLAPSFKAGDRFITKDDYTFAFAAAMINDVVRNESIIMETIRDFEKRIVLYKLAEVFFVTFLLLFPPYVFLSYSYLSKFNPLLIIVFILFVLLALKEVRFRKDSIELSNDFGGRVIINY